MALIIIAYACQALIKNDTIKNNVIIIDHQFVIIYQAYPLTLMH